MFFSRWKVPVVATVIQTFDEMGKMQIDIEPPGPELENQNDELQKNSAPAPAYKVEPGMRDEMKIFMQQNLLSWSASYRNLLRTDGVWKRCRPWIYSALWYKQCSGILHFWDFNIIACDESKLAGAFGFQLLSIDEAKKIFNGPNKILGEEENSQCNDFGTFGTIMTFMRNNDYAVDGQNQSHVSSAGNPVSLWIAGYSNRIKFSSDFSISPQDTEELYLVTKQEVE